MLRMMFNKQILIIEICLIQKKFIRFAQKKITNRIIIKKICESLNLSIKKHLFFCISKGFSFINCFSYNPSYTI